MKVISLIGRRCKAFNAYTSDLIVLRQRVLRFDEDEAIDDVSKELGIVGQR